LSTVAPEKAQGAFFVFFTVKNFLELTNNDVNLGIGNNIREGLIAVPEFTHVVVEKCPKLALAPGFLEHLRHDSKGEEG
jgi:hypothetical protein